MKYFILSLILAIVITALFFSKKDDFSFGDYGGTETTLTKMKYCSEIKIEGPSMEPTLKEGERVCVYSEKPELNNLIVFKCKNCGLEKTAVKRLTETKNDCYWVLGDNPDHSLDSREFGFLCPDDLDYVSKAKKSGF